MYVCMYVRMYVCMFVCVHVYIVVGKGRLGKTVNSVALIQSYRLFVSQSSNIERMF